jgi:hypothetical protein
MSLQRETQLAEIRYLLDTTLSFEICRELRGGPLAIAWVTVHNANAGHNWPSGASQDRRAWVEVSAYRKGELIYTNAVPGDEEPPADAKDAWILRDRLFAGDREVHMFWEADRVEAGTIGVALRPDPRNPQSFINADATRRFPSGDGDFPFASDGSGIPDRITVRVRLRAMGRDVLDDLVASGHLDPALPAQLPTFDLMPSRGRPSLPTLSEVSFEWNEEFVRTKPFTVTEDGRKTCVTMLKR